MTAPPQEPQTPEPRRLTRSSADRMVGGVAGGLGHYFGIDPLLFRVAFVVLTLAGGAGILAYAALWLFVPSDEPDAAAPASRSRGGLIAAGVVLLLLWIVIANGPFAFFFGPGILILALIVGAIVWFSLSARGERDTRSLALRTLVVLASIAGALLVAVAGGLVAALGGGVAVAAVVIVSGVALMIGAFVGGARWLILPALALASAAAFVAAADLRVTGGIGERSYRPASMADIRDEYELGMGELTVDLRDVDFTAADHPIALDLGVGEARVLLPDDVCVALQADLGAGWAQLYDDGAGGIDVEIDERPDRPAGMPRLLVSAEVGVGAIHIGDDTFDFDHDGPPFFRRWDDDGLLDRNPECV